MPPRRCIALGLIWVASVACAPNRADLETNQPVETDAKQATPRVALLETSRELASWGIGEHREWQPPGGAATTPASPPRPRCAHYRPERSAFFGDLHVHTSFSLDGYTRGGFQTPDDAYRFAKGETIGLAPRDTNGQPQRFATIDRPPRRANGWREPGIGATDPSRLMARGAHGTPPAARRRARSPRVRSDRVAVFTGGWLPRAVYCRVECALGQNG